MEGNLKVLHLSESSGWSGGAAQTLALACRLRDLGHENMIGCPEGGDLWRKAAASGIRSSHFRPRRDYDLPCAFALARLIERWKPDLVHAHHPKAHAMGLLAKAAGFLIEGETNVELDKGNKNARPRSLDSYYETVFLLRKPIVGKRVVGHQFANPGSAILS